MVMSMVNELKSRRQQVGRQMEEGSVMVLFAGNIVKYSNDMEYDFQVSRNFYYLTHVDTAGTVLVMYKKNEILQEFLFVPRRTAHYEMYYGMQETFAMYRDQSQIEAVIYAEELEEFWEGMALMKPFSAFYIADSGGSPQHMPSAEKEFARKMKALFPELPIKNMDYAIRNMRLIKSEAEQEKIRQAIALTGQGIKAVMEQIQPGLHEFDMAALFEYTVRRGGSEKLPFLVTAGGENIFAMHYTGDRKTLMDQEFFLIDCGASVGHYCADVTRTFPVNGVFTDRQKYWYEVCLKVQELTIKDLRPGTKRSEVGKDAREYLSGIFCENGYEAAPDTLRVFNDTAYAFVGQANHSFGLDAHEIGDDVLLPGMIYTVEPNIFIKKEGIGLRIEDDILITEEGPVNLTAFIPRTVEEIERTMRKNDRTAFNDRL